PQMLKSACKHFNIPTDIPISELSEDQLNMVLYGTNGEKMKFVYENDFGVRKEANVPFEGIVNNLERRYRDTPSNSMREWIEQFFLAKPCQTCKGHRLKKEILAVTIADKNIAYVTGLSIGQAYSYFNSLDLSEKDRNIAGLILKEIEARLGFLN